MSDGRRRATDLAGEVAAAIGADDRGESVPISDECGRAPDLAGEVVVERDKSGERERADRNFGCVIYFFFDMGCIMNILTGTTG